MDCRYPLHRRTLLIRMRASFTRSERKDRVSTERIFTRRWEASLSTGRPPERLFENEMDQVDLWPIVIGEKSVGKFRHFLYEDRGESLILARTLKAL
jgi:hypothetical protein